MNTMTPEQTALVKRSWEQLARIDAAVIGDVFYTKLFAETPGVKHLFTASRTEQAKKLMAMLGLLMEKLERSGEWQAELEKLALRHVQYGVQMRHYEAVGNALLWTFKIALGDDCTDDVEQAWLAWYNLTATTMKRAAYTTTAHSPDQH